MECDLDPPRPTPASEPAASAAENFAAAIAQDAQHEVEIVGAKLRDMMPWIKKNRLVDQSKN